MTRVVRLLAVMVALVAGAAPAQAAAAEPEMVLQDDAALLHRPADQVARTLDRLVTLGVDRVRITAGWSVLTRDADDRAVPVSFDQTDPAAYEQARWTGLDTAVRLARARKLRVVLDIGFWAPVWATADKTGPRARTSVNPQAYRDFALAVARRYDGTFVPPPAGPPPAPAPDDSVLDSIFGPGGVFGGAETGAEPGPADATPAPLPAVDQVILWNEPNHPALLLPQWRSPTTAPVSPEVYRRMVLAAYPAIKRLRPRLQVLVGNTSSTGGLAGSGPVAPLRFLRQLACVDARLRPIRDGACASFKTLPGDGWSHHPYTSGQSPIKTSGPGHLDDARIGDLPKLAALLDTLAARGRIAPAVRRIHLTEFGYETHDIGTRKGLTQRTQARWLTWAEYRAQLIPTVVATAQFLLGDTLPAPTRVSDSTARPFGEFYTGLLDGKGRDKLAVRGFTLGLFAQRRPDRRTLLWVRLRGGPAGARKTVTVQQLTPGGRWTQVGTARAPGEALRPQFTTASRSSATRYTAMTAAGGTYRLLTVAGGRRTTGLPVPVEPVAGG